MTDLLSVLLALTFSSPFPLQTAFAHSLSRQHPSTFLAATPSLNSESTPEELVNETCQANEALSNQRSSLFNSLTQLALWAGEPHLGMSTLIENLGPQVAAYLNPTPFPDINEKAKLARVPVFMYHDILPEKEVFFDVTPEEFENHLKRIQEQGATPISLEQLVTHLRTGLPLPKNRFC